MRWYYIKLGKELEHDLVEDQILREMAVTGSLSREDLIWPETGGAGWALAETIHGLFPEEREPLEVSIDRHEDDVEQVQERNRLARENFIAGKRRRKRRNLVLFAVLILGILCWSYRDKLLDRLPKGVKEQLPLPVDEKAIAEAKRVQAAELEKVRLEKIVASERVQLEGLKQSLKNGSLDKAAARKLIDLWFKYGDLGQISGYMGKILDSKNGITDATRFSVLTLASVMNDEQMVARSINDYKNALSATSSSQICLGIVAVCNERMNSEYALAVLESFLEKQPEASKVWLELAAIQASRGSDKEALESLKTACKTGGKAVKSQAISDKRFDSVRDTSVFRRYTED